MKKIILISLLVFNIFYTDVFCQSSKIKKTENEIYGMISGSALLMDVYQPVNSNHIGIIYIAGSGFGYFSIYQKVYNHPAIKDESSTDTAYSAKWVQELTSRGYTVFAINHRFAPRFGFPDPYYDCQRAVRYIRCNAKKFDIDPNHIGAMGHSSGGNLAAMLAVTDTIIVKAENKIDSSSSRVQAVVTLAAPLILSDFNRKGDSTIVSNTDLRIILAYIGELPPTSKGEFILSGKYAEASPISHITPDDSPILIYQSDDDPMIPTRQAVDMYQKLLDNKVPSKLMMVTKKGHVPEPDMNEVDNWFKKYLK